MKHLYIMCGIPGSGKSTWARNCCKHNPGMNFKIISRDEIRFSLLNESDSYFDKEKQVWDTFIHEINLSIMEKRNIIVDATHTTKASRKKLLSKLRISSIEYVVDVIVIKADLETALRNNEKREGLAYVPESVIKNFYNHFEMPDKNEFPYGGKLVLSPRGKDDFKVESCLDWRVY